MRTPHPRPAEEAEPAPRSRRAATRRRARQPPAPGLPPRPSEHRATGPDLPAGSARTRALAGLATRLGRRHLLAPRATFRTLTAVSVRYSAPARPARPRTPVPSAAAGLRREFCPARPPGLGSGHCALGLVDAVAHEPCGGSPVQGCKG